MFFKKTEIFSNTKRLSACFKSSHPDDNSQNYSRKTRCVFCCLREGCRPLKIWTENRHNSRVRLRSLTRFLKCLFYRIWKFFMTQTMPVAYSIKSGSCMSPIPLEELCMHKKYGVAIIMQYTNYTPKINIKYISTNHFTYIITIADLYQKKLDEYMTLHD